MRAWSWQFQAAADHECDQVRQELAPSSSTFGPEAGLRKVNKAKRLTGGCEERDDQKLKSTMDVRNEKKDLHLKERHDTNKSKVVKVVPFVKFETGEEFNEIV